MENRKQADRKSPSDGRPEHAKSQSSTSARILKSASALFCDAVHPNTSQAARTLSDALTSVGKAGSSSASSESSRPTASEQCGGLSIERQRRRVLPHSNDAFREPPQPSRSLNTKPLAILKEPSYGEFIDNENLHTGSLSWQSDSNARGKEKVPSMTSLDGYDSAAKSRWISAWNAPSKSRLRLPLELHAEQLLGAPNAVEEDGADVLKLLQDPSFSPWTDEVEEQETPFTMSRNDWKNSNDFIRQMDKATNSVASGNSKASKRNDGHTFSTVSSFFDDVENYQREVWGYDQPLLEGKEQVVEAGPSSSYEDPPTRRLKLLLGHLDECWR